jgi:hypothetical protein
MEFVFYQTTTVNSINNSDYFDGEIPVAKFPEHIALRKQDKRVDLRFISAVRRILLRF